MRKSESISALAAALATAQGEMGGAVKSSNNPFFDSKYADLGEVIKTLKKPFADNGISVSQFPFNAEGGVGVTTILMHGSGEWLESDYVLPLKKSDPQAAGGAITYARRYALASVAGIPQVDDDANFASSEIDEIEQPKTISKKKIKELQKLVDDCGRTDEQFCNWIKIDKIENILASDVAKIQEQLESRIIAVKAAALEAQNKPKAAA